jgi:non-specific serine/threonine protein kinase
MANSQNDFQSAESLCRQSLRIASELQDSEAIGWSLAWLAIPLGINGNVREAVETAESAVGLGRRLQDPAIELVATAVLCNVLPMAGQAERAIELGEQGLRMSRDRGELWVRGYLLMAASQAHWSRGERHLAEAEARDGAASRHALGDRAGLQALLETLAWMAAERGTHQRAATLLGCAERVRQASAVHLLEGYREQHDRALALALGGLGQRPFDAASERGLAMTIEEAVAFAVEERLPARPVAVRTQPKTPLTRRELEVARLIADEMSSREIASKLFISERTVETHVTHIFNKLGLSSRTQLSRWLASAGL